MLEDLQRFISQRQITEGDVFADFFDYVTDFHLRFSHDIDALYHARDRGSFKNSLKAKRGAISEDFAEDDTADISKRLER